MYNVKKISRNVSEVHISAKGVFEQYFLISGDRHWDNPMSDHDLQIKHLKQASEKGAGVIDVGDFFCAMQGKWDKRSSKELLRPEHKREDYLDALVETAAEFFGPYKNNLIVIGEGNHETSIIRKHETNLINNLIKALRPSKIYNGGFSGWINFLVGGKSFKLHYHHGYGGGGPVTRDVIQTNRKAVYLPDADIVISGHTHDDFQVPIRRVRFSDQSVLSQDEQVHVKIPTYKDEYADGWGGFHMEKGRCPKPVGAYWLRFFRDCVTDPIRFEFQRAR